MMLHARNSSGARNAMSRLTPRREVAHIVARMAGRQVGSQNLCHTPQQSFLVFHHFVIPR